MLQARYLNNPRFCSETPRVSAAKKKAAKNRVQILLLNQMRERERTEGHQRRDGQNRAALRSSDPSRVIFAVDAFRERNKRLSKGSRGSTRGSRGCK